MPQSAEAAKANGATNAGQTNPTTPHPTPEGSSPEAPTRGRRGPRKPKAERNYIYFVVKDKRESGELVLGAPGTPADIIGQAHRDGVPYVRCELFTVVSVNDGEDCVKLIGEPVK